MRQLLLVLTFFLAGCSSQDAVSAPYPALQIPNEVAASIDVVLADAKASDRLAMLVLGANWCHDSTDFVAMIQEAELVGWLEEHYAIGLFNVGYMDHVREYLAPFEVPVIYGTPTVLVVDPASRRLLNRSQHYYWRNASNLTPADARSYFSTYLTAPPAVAEPSPELADALERIDNFEAAQGERIYRAFAVLSPLLKQYDDGDVPADFEAKWGNLAKMRGRITGDLEALRKSAREQEAAGERPIELDFPQYTLFID